MPATRRIAPGPTVGLGMTELVEISRQAHEHPDVIAALQATRDGTGSTDEYYTVLSVVRKPLVTAALEAKRAEVKR